jgi:hypothetical protein
MSSFMNTLNDLREEYGKPIIVLSGARCAEHNAKVGGAKQSAHIEGRAVDIERSPALLGFCHANLEKFGLWMEDPNFTKGWIHLTDRPPPGWKPGMSVRTFKP